MIKERIDVNDIPPKFKRVQTHLITMRNIVIVHLKDIVLLENGLDQY